MKPASSLLLFVSVHWLLLYCQALLNTTTTISLSTPTTITNGESISINASVLPRIIPTNTSAPNITGTFTLVITSDNNDQLNTSVPVVTNGTNYYGKGMFDGTYYLSGGMHRIEVNYSGDTNYGSSTSGLSLTVNPAPVTLTIPNTSGLVNTFINLTVIFTVPSNAIGNFESVDWNYTISGPNTPNLFKNNGTTTLAQNTSATANDQSTREYIFNTQYSGGTAGEYYFQFYFNGDNNYAATSTVGYINVYNAAVITATIQPLTNIFVQVPFNITVEASSTTPLRNLEWGYGVFPTTVPSVNETGHASGASSSTLLTASEEPPYVYVINLPYTIVYAGEYYVNVTVYSDTGSSPVAKQLFMATLAPVNITITPTPSSRFIAPQNISFAINLTSPYLFPGVLSGDVLIQTPYVTSRKRITPNPNQNGSAYVVSDSITLATAMVYPINVTYLGSENYGISTNILDIDVRPATTTVFLTVNAPQSGYAIATATIHQSYDEYGFKNATVSFYLGNKSVQANVSVVNDCDANVTDETICRDGQAITNSFVASNLEVLGLNAVYRNGNVTINVSYPVSCYFLSCDECIQTTELCYWCSGNSRCESVAERSQCKSTSFDFQCPKSQSKREIIIVAVIMSVIFGCLCFGLCTWFLFKKFGGGKKVHAALPNRM